MPPPKTPAPLNPEEKYREHEFGLIALKKGYVTEAQLDECLKIQQQSEENFRLGQIMVRQHYITVQQFLGLLSLQEKKILLCNRCGAKFNIAHFTPGKKIRCTRCKQILSVPEELDSIGVQGTMTPTSMVPEEVSSTEAENSSSEPSKSSKPSEPLVKKMGDYEILHEIARGGMGIVYKAKQVSLNRIVALKVLISGEFANEEQIKRFKREAESAGSLTHPNIVRVLDVGEIENQYYISMEYIDGADLNAVCERKIALDENQLLTVLIEIAEALHFAHKKGLIHRDVKPANVLLDKNYHPHLTDFGLAKFIDRGQSLLTRGDSALGTPLYMAPEQARGEARKVDARTDIYALGVMSYQLFTKKLPYIAKNSSELYDRICNQIPASLSSINPQISPDIERVVLKALEKEKEKRFQTALAMAEEFRRILEKKPILTKAPSIWEKGKRTILQNQKVLLLLTLIFLLLFGIVFLIQFFPNKTPLFGSQEKITQKSQQLLKQVYALDPKEYTRAIELLNEICLLEPNRLEPKLLRIQFYLEGNLLPTAEKELLLLEPSCLEEPLFYFIRGQFHLKSKNLSLAQSDFEQCLHLDFKKYLEAYLYLSQIRLASENEVHKNIKDLNFYLESDGKQTKEAYTLRGKSRKYLDPQEALAVTDFQQALSLAPESLDLLMEYTQLLLDQKKLEEATESANRSLALEKQNAALYCLRAEIYAQKGQEKEALQDFESALSINASFIPVYLKRSQYHLENVRLSEADKDLQKALSFEKENPEVLYRLAEIAMIEKKWKRAENFLETLLKLQASSSRGLLLAGKIASHQKEWDKALEYFSRSLANPPSDALRLQAYLGLARVYLAQKNLKTALEKLEQCLKLDATCYSVYLCRGKIFYLNAQTASTPKTIKEYRIRAEDDFTQAIQLMSKSYTKIYEEIRQHLTAKRYYRVTPILNRLLLFDPDFALGYYQRGQSYLAENRLEEALTDFSETLDLIPTYLEALLGKARVLIAQKQYIEAEQLFHQILTPEGAYSVEALLQCAKMNLSIGVKEHASKDASLILKSYPTHREALEILEKTK
ncbi:MAG: protein kinase [Planctomycetota bacterium]